MDNYDDHITISKYIEEQQQQKHNSKTVILSQKELESTKFFSLHDTSSNRTLWQGYSDEENETTKRYLIGMLPSAFKNELTTTSKQHAQYDHFSLVFVSYKNEIPAVVNTDEETGTTSERSFKVPGHMTMEKIVAYLYN